MVIHSSSLVFSEMDPPLMDPHTDESRNNTYEGSMPGVKVKLSHMFERINLSVQFTLSSWPIRRSLTFLTHRRA